VTVTVQEAMGQHVTVVNKVVMEHVLWCPSVLDICPSVVGQVKQTFVQLNDGRQCSIVTQVSEESNIIRAETLVSDWVLPV
jgi:hypothetical protein